MLDNIQGQSALIGQLLWENSPQQKKARILEAILKVTVTEGVSAVTVTRLAQETKLSKALINYHVPDFNDALSELLQLAASSGRKLIQIVFANPKNGDEKLRLYIRASFEWVRRYPDLSRFYLLMYHRSSVDPRVRKQHEENLELGQARMMSLMKESGYRSKNLPIKTCARVLHSALVAEILRTVALNNFDKLTQVEEDFWAFTQSVLKGTQK